MKVFKDWDCCKAIFLLLAFFCLDAICKNTIIDIKIVGQTYKKNSHAGLAYQLITFPSLVRNRAIKVQENIDANHEIMITPTHISTCLMYIQFLISVSDNAEFDCITQICLRKREPIFLMSTGAAGSK